MEDKVKEIAECAICTDLFTDPRMLPCIHTFCLKCLNKMSAKASFKPGDSVPCPLCRTPFVIPTVGMGGLKRNFFMERLIEAVKMSQPVENVSCEICIEDDESRSTTEVPVATQYCIQCQQKICNNCAIYHKRVKSLKEHQLIQLGDPKTGEFMKKFSKQYCDQHSKREVEMFCFNCKQVICVRCLAAEHRSHEFAEIEELGEKFQEEIINDLRHVKNFSKKVAEKVRKTMKNREAVINKFAAVEKAIFDRRNELIAIIDKRTTELLDELASIKQQKLKQLEAEHEENEKFKATVESLELYLDELISKGNLPEICRSFNDLHSRSNDLQNSSRYQNLSQFSPIRVSFVPTNLNDSLKTENIMGRIIDDVGHDQKCHARNKSKWTPVALATQTKFDRNLVSVIFAEDGRFISKDINEGVRQPQEIHDEKYLKEDAVLATQYESEEEFSYNNYYDEESPYGYTG